MLSIFYGCNRHATSVSIGFVFNAQHNERKLRGSLWQVLLGYLVPLYGSDPQFVLNDRN